MPSQETYVVASGNKVDINFGPDWASQQLRVTTNSSSKQYVRIQADGHEFEASGSGEGNNIFERDFKPTCRKVSITLEYEGSDGQRRPVKVNTGGPYDIGSLRLLVAVGETGDDADYNDVIVKFQGNIKRK